MNFNLRNFAKKIYEKKIVVLIIILLFAILGILYTLNWVTPKYRASSTFILGKENNTSSSNSQNLFLNSGFNISQQKDITITSGLIETYSQILKSKSFANLVKDELKIEADETELASALSIKRVKNSDIIQISFVNKNYNVANNTLKVVEKIFFNKIQEIYKIDNIYIIDEPSVSNTPYNVNHLRDVFLFIILGFVISNIYVLLSWIVSKTKVFNKISEFLKLKISSFKVKKKNKKEQNEDITKLANNESEIDTKKSKDKGIKNDNMNLEQNHQIEISEYNQTKKEENLKEIDEKIDLHEDKKIQKEETKKLKEEKRKAKKKENKEKINVLKHQIKRKFNRSKKKFLIKKNKFLKTIRCKKENLENRYLNFIEKRKERIADKKEQKEIEKVEKIKKSEEEKQLKEEKEIKELQENETNKKDKEKEAETQQLLKDEEQKNIEQEKKKIFEAELRAKKEAEAAIIKERERLKREEERERRQLEKAKKEEERLKKLEELRKQKEEEKKKKEIEKARLQEIKLTRELENAKNREEEKQRKEEVKIKKAKDAKFTDEYIEQNLYPKTKFNKF